MSSMKPLTQAANPEPLPRIDIRTSFVNAYRLLSANNCSVFILIDGIAVIGYVDAFELATGVVEWFGEDQQKMKQLSTATIGQLIREVGVVSTLAPIDMRETATKKTAFLCLNGHRNPDPDHGRCYSCPGKIVGTERA
jgi:hypothetical protein